MTSSMVFEVTRLWLHTKTHTGEDKHESRYSIIEGTGWYKGGQQGHTITEGWNVDQKNDSQGYNVEKIMKNFNLPSLNLRLLGGSFL